MILRQRCFHKGGITGPGIHGNTLSDGPLFEALKKKHAKIFFNNDFSKNKELLSNQFAYRKKLHEYLKCAQDTGVPIETAINLHKKEIAYKVSVEIRKGRHKGQVPGVIVNSNASEDFSFSILGSGRFDANGNWAGGVFGDCINVSNDKHLQDLDDYIGSFFIINHLNSHKGAPTVPAIFFLTANGVMHEEKGVSEESILSLAIKRRELFMEEASQSGYFISNAGKTPILEVMAGRKPKKIFMPVVIHDLKSCAYYVLEGGTKTDLLDWLKQNGLGSQGVFPEVAENLRMHKEEHGYFEGLVGMMRSRKVVTCVDSRSFRENTGMIKKLGGFISKKMREWILTKAGLETVFVDLHSRCGYVSTAMAIHLVGRELGAIFRKGISGGNKEKAEELRSFFKSALKKVFEQEKAAFDLDVFLNEMALIKGATVSSGTKRFLANLFDSQTNETRDTVTHLRRNGLLIWHGRSGSVSMPVAAKVDHMLADKGYLQYLKEKLSHKNADKYSLIVHLALANQQQNAWEAHVNELVANGKLEKKIKIKVRLEDYGAGKVYYTKNGLDMYDVMTNEIVAANILER